MFAKKRKQAKILVLSFYADVGIWDNLIYVPGYPSGMSYFRPFRYRDKWISNELQEELKETGSREKLVGAHVILATRFGAEEYRSLILPIRNVEITHIDYIPDNICIYFKLGPFFTIDFNQEIISQCLKFNSEDSGIPKGHLFFRCDAREVPKPWGINKNENEIWIQWINKICNDKSLPFNDKARRSVFFRISGMRGKKTLEIKKIFSSWNMGPIYGFMAQEGCRYELTYLHRVPSLFNTNKSIPKFQVAPVAASASNWEFSKIDEEISSNYQAHAITMGTLAPSATWEQIRLKPDKEELKIESSEQIYTVPFNFYIRIKKSNWLRFRTVYIWLILLGLFVVIKDPLSSALKGEDFTRDLVIGFFVYIILIFGYIISQKNLLK
jgi:hypothetical protein